MRQRSSLVIQFQTETLSREAEIKMKWTIYSIIEYNLWSSDTKNQQWRRIQSQWSEIEALPWRNSDNKMIPSFKLEKFEETRI